MIGISVYIQLNSVSVVIYSETYPSRSLQTVEIVVPADDLIILRCG